MSYFEKELWEMSRYGKEQNATERGKNKPVGFSHSWLNERQKQKWKGVRSKDVWNVYIYKPYKQMTKREREDAPADFRVLSFDNVYDITQRNSKRKSTYCVSRGNSDHPRINSFFIFKFSNSIAFTLNYCLCWKVVLFSHLKYVTTKIDNGN